MKNRPSKFFRGFKFAFRGVIHCINNERNMRFHTAVMLYVLAFSPFFTLTKTQYAVLILTISSVISAEMLNTAAEELADLSAADYNPLARAAKDIAAGAVLVCAFFSVVVGAVILWQPIPSGSLDEIQDRTQEAGTFSLPTFISLICRENSLPASK